MNGASGSDRGGARQRAVDSLLVIAAQAGDPRALEALVRRWHGRLVAHGWRLTGDKERAEDAVQAAWTDIVRDLSSLNQASAFPAWAYRIVTRKAGAVIGDQIAERQLAEALGTAPDASSDAPADPAFEDASLRSAVAALPPGHRAAVALHYFEGLRVAEVAVALGVPSGTVKSRLMHARSKLRTLLEGERDGQRPD